MLTLDMAIVLALVGITLVLFFREVLPIPITALLAAVILMTTGILTPEEGLSGFSNTATIAVLAMFVLSAGIRLTGGVNRITNWLSGWAGDSPRRQLLAVGAAAGPASGFVNNTAVVAVLIPSTIDMARRSGRSPSLLLMPMSHIAMLGGLLTLIGTSTNLLGSAALANLGYRPFGFFEFTLVGVVALVVAIVYHLTLGPYLVPDRGSSKIAERFDLEGFMGELVVPPGSPLVGKSILEAELHYGTGAQVVRLTRGSRRYDAPPRGMMLREGDELLIEASRERLAELGDGQRLIALPEIKNPLRLEEPQPGDVVTAEVVISNESRYVGRRLGDIDFRQRYDAMVLAIRRQGRVESGALSATRIRAGDILLVQASPDAIDRMRERPGLFLTREREMASYRTAKLPYAIAIILGVVFVSAMGWLHISVAALGGAALMVILGCLNLDEMLRSIHWDIILMLAGIIPLGLALEKTGTAALVGSGLISLGAHLPEYWFFVLLFIITSLITEAVSNNASVVLLVPIAVAAAAGLGLEPRSVALVVTLAASTSMMTPIGYQTNTMIYAPGDYRFKDFARGGGLLNVILAFVIPAMVMLVLTS